MRQEGVICFAYMLKSLRGLHNNQSEEKQLETGAPVTLAQRSALSVLTLSDTV